ncbi:molybdenum cofactor biosynthesis protein B [Alphaproteobacteria bacterium]|nr:molybdenum cofactor biosynthesis protein B [Alphaproteobacteria bacterium]
MSRLDETRPFIPVRIAVLTVSDTRTLADDKSGDLLVSRLIEVGHELGARAIVHDDEVQIIKALRGFIVMADIDCVIATGGTGLTGRDVTPEAFRAVFDKEIDGFGEMFRFLSFQKIGTSTLQSRAVAGVASGTYLFALPGSPSACKDAWDDLLVHQLDYRHRPCNFVEIMPRLTETGRADRPSGK